MTVGIDDALVRELVCAVTRTGLRHDAERSLLVSDEAGLAYPVRNGTPVLLSEEARPA